MNNRTKSGSVTRTSIFLSILLSILIALSGMAAMAAADGIVPPPNKFSGAVTLNGAPAPIGTTINASIDGNPRGSTVVESLGEYEHLSVNGSASDDGMTVTFKVCGATAEQTATWTAWLGHVQILDLTAGDNEAIVVTDANANPPSIVADGISESQLTVTVTSGCEVGPVTVNLSAIGGAAAQDMGRIGATDVYTVTVTAAEGTPADAHCLYVNASDVCGNYDTSVCIVLEIVETTTLIGDINGDTKVDIDDLILLGQAWGKYPGDTGYNSAADINGNGEIDIDDLILLGQNWTG